MSDAIRTNRMRCRVAVVSCSLLSFLVFLAVCDQLLSTPDAIVQEVGWKSYHMFTILANMFAGIAAALCIPYAVDGLRYDNYHLPRWVVNVLYMATTGVALTFLIAVTVLSPMTSYYRMMLYSNNILFHTINPIIAILLFIFINSDHKVSFRSTFLAIAPVVLYAALYFVLVFVIGEENGGWRDHYQIRDITQYVPLPLVVLGMVLIAFAVALLLRAAHNSVHKKRKKTDRILLPISGRVRLPQHRFRDRGACCQEPQQRPGRRTDRAAQDPRDDGREVQKRSSAQGTLQDVHRCLL